MNNFGKLFMAFAAGTESAKQGGFSLYEGLGKASVVAVNPTKEELEKIYNRDIERDIEYLGTTTNSTTNQEVEQLRVDFILKLTAEDNNGCEFYTKRSYFLQNAPFVNKAGTKVQVIDKYGRTAWVTKEEMEKKVVPTYSNGPALLDSDYRPAYIGEERLVSFIKALLCIPTVQWRKDGVIHTNKNPENCEAGFSDINALFKENYKELKEIVKYQPDNKVKLAFGVRTVDDNKQYQDSFDGLILKENDNNIARLDKAISDSQEQGAYPNTVFSVEPLHEYTNTPSTPNDTTAGEAPKTPKWF